MEGYEPMLQWIQQHVKLTGYTHEKSRSLWNDVDLIDTATDFLTDPSSVALFASFDLANQLLVLCKDNPPKPAPGMKDVAFFVRQEGSSITPENIAEVITTGTVAMTQTAASVMHIVEKVFYPHIFHSMDWSKSTRSELLGLYHRFVASLMESANEAEGKTRLYVPFQPGDEKPDAEQQARGGEFVQQLESVAIHWTRQIKGALNNHTGAIHDDMDGGPMEEIAFWRARSADLSGIADQLRGDDIQYVITVLQVSDSNYLAPLLALSDKIEHASEEAKANLKFLDILTEPCERLSRMTPEEIPAVLPHFLNCTRVVVSLSDHYNTAERVAGLIRKATNEVMRRCRAHISLADVLNGDVCTVRESLQHSIHCGVEWKRLYRRTAVSQAAKMPAIRWDFDNATIFAQMDAFVQRCRDLMDMCEGRIQFLQVELSPSAETFDEDIEKSLLGISKAFRIQIAKLEQLDYDILDVRCSQWHEDFKTYKAGVKDLDLIYSNVITKAFGPIRQIDAAVNTLQAFSRLAHRDAVRRAVQKAADGVRALFLSECDSIRREFDNNRWDPPLRMGAPKYSGRALWAGSLITTARRILSLVKSPARCTIVQDEAERAVNSLVETLHAYQLHAYNDWLSSLPSLDSGVLKTRLDQPLLRKERSGNQQFRSLSCNFDPEILSLLYEVQSWEKFHIDDGFEVPSAVLGVCHQREVLRVAREHVMSMLRFFNELLSDLTESESRLFSSHLRSVEKKLAPGLSKLQWSSRPVMIERFVNVCVSSIQDTHRKVKQFHASMNIIKQQWYQISSLSLIKIDRNTSYRDDMFANKQEAHRNECVKTLLTAHSTMIEQVESMFSHFVEGPDDVHKEWRSYLQMLDEQILDSLSASVKESLRKLSSAINGDDDSSDGACNQIIFHVCVALVKTRVECKPTMISITHAVNMVAKELICIVKSIPRIQDVHSSATAAAAAAAAAGVGGDASEERSNKKTDHYFYDALASDEAILTIVVKIMNGVASAAADIRRQVACWSDSHKSLFMDKASFIRRYEKARHPVETFSRDITREKSRQSDIEAEPPHIVKFIKVETSSLKTSLITHSVELQNKLIGLLRRNADEKLQDLEGDIRKLVCPPKPAVDTGTLQQELDVAEGKFAPLQATYNVLTKFNASSEAMACTLEKLRSMLEAHKEEVISATGQRPVVS